MCLTRSARLLCLAAMAAAGAMLVGCVPADRNTAAIELNPTPIKEDQAMARRNWELAPVWYTNIGVTAGPTGQTFIPSRNIPERLQPFTDTPIFLANAFLMPARLSVVWPWTPIDYRGVTTPPTYTASPPLRDETRKTR